jgi:hypothetical protein
VLCIKGKAMNEECTTLKRPEDVAHSFKDHFPPPSFKAIGD